MDYVNTAAPWTSLFQLLNLIIVVGIPAVLLILLQIWLSKRESRIPGLILPALHLIFSIVVILSFAAYSVTGGLSATTVVTDSRYEAIIEQEDERGVLVLEEDTEAAPDESHSVGIIGGADGPTAIFVAGPSDILSLLPLLLLLNIPTAAHLLIYFVQRRKRDHRKTIDKTRIQDL